MISHKTEDFEIHNVIDWYGLYRRSGGSRGKCLNEVIGVDALPELVNKMNWRQDQFDEINDSEKMGKQDVINIHRGGLVMKTEINIKEVGELIKKLAEAISLDGVECEPSSLLEAINGRGMAVYEVEAVTRYLDEIEL